MSHDQTEQRVSPLYQQIISGAVSVAGTGIPEILQVFSQLANTAAVANAINFTPPLTAGLYRLTCYFIATTATTFSIDFQATYTNGTGTAKTEKIPGIVAGTSTVVSPFTNVTAGGAAVYATALIQINAGGAAITLSTVGTFTTVTYNLAAVLERLA